MMLLRTVLLLAGLGLVSLGASAIRYSLNDKLHWRDARWDSSGIAPAPHEHQEALILVYAARAHGWRGIFGVHSWVAWKPHGGDAYTRADVVGWGVGRGANAIRLRHGTADNYWAGNAPVLIGELAGEAASRSIRQIEKAIDAYPYNHRYRIWPGPNSNSFIAFLLRSAPELKAALPAEAIGKDYLGDRQFFAAAPSNTGYQLSFWGLAGIMLALEEGLEINLLGLTFGIDFRRPALKLPGFGRLGMTARIF